MSIKSVLDNDLYKFTMQAAVVSKHRGTMVSYKFINRGNHKFNKEAVEYIKKEVDRLHTKGLAAGEFQYLRDLRYIPSEYTDYINSSTSFLLYDKNVVNIDYSNDNLSIEISGKWEECILWEVPLMAIISDAYFEFCHTSWDYTEQIITPKIEYLEKINFADFGTRRRRSLFSQQNAIDKLKSIPTFIGTSNVHFARTMNLKPIGTFAHEWVMAHAALEGIKHANKFAMQSWADVFNGELGIALTDTYGSNRFFEDFDGNLARLFDGVRHDSGDPLSFTEKTIAHYKSLRIDPTTKTIVFSDGLTPQRACEIKDFCDGRIRTSFGIGTNLTNDFEDKLALNIVIKLWSVNGIPVVKLSDVPSKATGDRDAIRVCRWIVDGTPLDKEI